MYNLTINETPPGLMNATDLADLLNACFNAPFCLFIRLNSPSRSVFISLSLSNFLFFFPQNFVLAVNDIGISHLVA